MSTPTVVEIDSFTDDSEDSFYDDLADAGVVGVLIKVSQGDRWLLHDAPEKVRRATAAGLHLGALHYLEPGRASIEAQRLYFTSNLPPSLFSLGLVLELDDFGGREAYELAAEIGVAIEGLAMAGFTPGVRLTSEVAQQMTANIKTARLWLDGEQLAGMARPFAVVKVTAQCGMVPGALVYSLVSARMLNAVESASVATAADPPEDPDEQAETPEDGPGSPESPAPGTGSGLDEPEPETTTTQTPGEVADDPGEQGEADDLAAARANALASL